MNTRAITAALAAAVVGLSFGAGNPNVSTFTDKRDGKVYKIVKVGSKTWFAENLNYNMEGSECYENSADSCAKYGRLYDWSTAVKACPAGWRLPIDAEWTALENSVGGSETAGKKLKSANGWKDKGNGTNEYGFSAMPGGNGYGGSFKDAAGYGVWWSTTEYSASSAWYRFMGYDNDSVGRDYFVKAVQMSVRCIENYSGSSSTLK